MYIEFDSLPAQARVWIYQSSRDFTNSEVSEISTTVQKFISQWQAHGADLQASFQIMYNRFIIIGANQDFHAPTGCSIDSSVAVIRQIEQHLRISLFERTQIPFKADGGEIQTTPMNELKEQVAKGEINVDSITFNNLVENVGQFKTKWEVPAKETWLKKYFGVTV
ncbi:MAG: chemotaxis regulatin CheY-phosphate phosphatase CheZ [Arenicella sp.]|jgi:chemotaxis regulatin CheY-phosphate phosphatase CheZ